MGLKATRHRLAFAAISVAPMALGADTDNGKHLAQRWCASGHVVASNQRQANADAPPYEHIAGTFGVDAKKLVFFLLEPHPKMPSMALTRREADDIAAHIGILALTRPRSNNRTLRFWRPTLAPTTHPAWAKACRGRETG